eukprot:Trichotokara_eunicae@DN5836_c0_g1_i2.p1
MEPLHYSPPKLHRAKRERVFDEALKTEWAGKGNENVSTIHISDNGNFVAFIESGKFVSCLKNFRLNNTKIKVEKGACCMGVRKDLSLLAVGTSKGKVSLVSPEKNELIRSFSHSPSSEDRVEVCVCGFVNQTNIYVGDATGGLFVYDISNTGGAPIWEANTGSRIRCASSRGTTIAVGGADGTISVFVAKK